jgi:hypothetical protein
MALSAPLNYQQEAKEIPLYGDINSEEETPKSIPRSKEGSPPSSDSGSRKSKSPDGGSTTSEGELGENYSGLALIQLGSTSTPEHQDKINLLRSFSSASSHLVFLGTNGELYSWDANNKGTLGLGDQYDRLLPSKVSLPILLGHRVVFVALGCQHTLLTSNNN